MTFDTAVLLGIFLLNGVILFFAWRSRGEESVRLMGERIEKTEAHMDRIVREEMAMSRHETNRVNENARKETSGVVREFRDVFDRQTSDLKQTLAKDLRGLVEYNEKKMNEVRDAVEKRLESIQRDNGEKLEKMRETVDEKLHATLNKRLGESFEMVNNQLEAVQKGLGEMQVLAVGVGDLKKVLQNVKTRGTWGETQLENILADILTPDQYLKNVCTKKGSNDRVEFAVRLPGRDDKGTLVPIDAKFPLEDYQSLVDASERGDVEAIDRFSKALELRVKSEAKDIMNKYLDPPHTTDFGILFVPNEGLYAEILRRPGFVDTLQRECRVFLAGPTIIGAYLSSLRMGFRTVAIEKRTSEIREVLERVKKEFSTFGDLLDKTRKKLQEASNTIDTASQKSRTIERVLGKVQELPVGSEATKAVIEQA